GTSMSAAFVTGVAGLLLSRDIDLTKDELIILLKENVNRIQCSSGGDDCNKLGTGIINAQKSLKALGGGGTNELEAVAYVGEKENKDYIAKIGEEVRFFGEDSKKPEGITLRFQWDFGDGGVSSVENATYVYNEEGAYKVSLTVLTEDFETSVDSVNVTVSEQGAENMIRVLGQATQGGVSQEGVDVEMKLIDEAGNSVVTISDTTDSEGKFEIEFKDVNPGQNYSVDLMEPSRETNVLKNLSTGEHYTYDIKQSGSGGGGGEGGGVSALCNRCKMDAMGLSSEAINLQGPHSYGKSLDEAKQSIGEAIQKVSKDMQGCPNASSIQFWLNRAINELSKKECTPGKDGYESCGNDGKIKHRKCQYNGMWGNWGNCSSPSYCEPSCEEQCPVGFLSECTDPVNNTCICTRGPLEQKTDGNAYKYTCSECKRYYTADDCQEKGWCQ
ncbi:MAG: PKD domain-containing protein, partial [Candidatus Saelkia tenebricola]|nr:PKD domain-containing protein [Candidatus Saelkia tenebricola]